MLSLLINVLSLGNLHWNLYNNDLPQGRQLYKIDTSFTIGIDLSILFYIKTDTSRNVTEICRNIFQ